MSRRIAVCSLVLAVVALGVNGELAVSHPYGYTGFPVDLTERVHSGANVIAVKVQNRLHVQTKPEGADGKDVDVVSTIRDARGRVVARGKGADLRVRHPHLWSTEDPYLHTLQTDVVVGHRTVDSTSTRFGIRWFRIDPNEGLFVNGHYLKVYGVDLHHDLGALGAATRTTSSGRRAS